MSAFDLNNDLYLFLKADIRFNRQFNTYIFNGQWVTEIAKEYFTQYVDHFKQKLIEQLKIGRNNEIFLQELKELIDSQTMELKNFRQYSPGSIKIFKVKTDFDFRDEPPVNENLNLEFVEFTEIIVAQGRHYEFSSADEINLLYILGLFNETVIEIYNFINKWELDLDYTDMDKFDSLTIPSDRNLKPKKLLCNSSYTKLNIAHLFQFLKDSCILYFDKHNKKDNDLNFNRFIESNFKYWSVKENNEKTIQNINKEFSEVNAPISEDKHLIFLNSLVNIINTEIEKRKNH